VTQTTAPFSHSTLGRTGRLVFRLGLGSSYGLGTAGVEEAVERGVTYLYWGSSRRPSFGRGITRACAGNRRDRVTVVVQSYTRLAALLRPSLEGALRSLKLDHADVLLLGWWNQPPSRRLVDAATALRDAGRVRHLALSTHHRPLLPGLAAGPFDVFHVRYNAAHRGAEPEVLDALPADRSLRPGLVTFTTTRWKTLLQPVPGHDGPPLTAAECYRFALSHPQVDVVMSGPADVAQLREALDAVERGPLGTEEMERIRSWGDALHARGDRLGFLRGFLNNWRASRRAS
jgi:predicted aldo/keto reductase-like oxidoreductase